MKATIEFMREQGEKGYHYFQEMQRTTVQFKIRGDGALLSKKQCVCEEREAQKLVGVFIWQVMRLVKQLEIIEGQ
jgi:hypothetical protein